MRGPMHGPNMDQRGPMDNRGTMMQQGPPNQMGMDRMDTGKLESVCWSVFLLVCIFHFCCD